MPGWALDCKKSNSTGCRVAVSHWRPERLNSIVSGNPAAATRMRFLPFASNTASTMIPTGNLISKYIFGRLPCGQLEHVSQHGSVTTLAFVMDLKFCAAGYNCFGTAADAIPGVPDVQARRFRRAGLPGWAVTRHGARKALGARDRARARRAAKTWTPQRTPVRRAG